MKVCLLFLCFLGKAVSLTCYQCPKAKVVNSTCSDGGDRTEWCKSGEWCQKSWNNQDAVSWGCAEQPPSEGYETCLTEERDSNSTQTVCYCSGDLCNTAPDVSLPVALITLGLLVLLA